MPIIIKLVLRDEETEVQRDGNNLSKVQLISRELGFRSGSRGADLGPLWPPLPYG